MLSYLYPAASCRPRLPSGLRLAGIGWLWLACASLTLGQDPQRQELQRKEVQQPARVPVPGEVVVSISIRVTSDHPRFVVAARVVEETIQKEGPQDISPSIALESPPEIVDFFKRSAQERIAQIDRVCELTSQQNSKLELAAMGDMSRLVRESRELREKHAGKALRNPQQQLAIFEDVAVVNRHLSEGVLRSGSMFLMVLKSLLTPMQRAQLAQAKFVELSTAWPIELSDEQRQQIWQLVRRLHAPDSPPLLWFPKHCRELIAELPRQELAELVGESKTDTLRRWYPL